MANLSASEVKNLILNVSKVMQDVKVTGKKLTANWPGKFYRTNKNGTVSVLWEPRVSASIEDVSSDLLEGNWKNGEWLEYEVKSLGWVAK